MNRRHFFQCMALSGIAVLGSKDAAEAARVVSKAAQTISKSGNGFTLWQIPSQINTIGNSYVLITNKGRIVVMDGGVKEETPFLRGFLGALGNEVEAWFISHPHNDHMGALNEILKSPGQLRINRIYHSRFSPELLKQEPEHLPFSTDFYQHLDEGKFPVTDLREPGLELKIDALHIKILGVTNEEYHQNPYNNSSIVIRVWDRHKSVVFLGDAGVECGNKVLRGPYGHYLNCDYLQMAHHGQQGCDEAFYKTIQFRACLWPTPSWVWNNDAGKGINTAHLKTFDTRRWMDEKGIREHHVSCLEGLWRLD